MRRALLFALVLAGCHQTRTCKSGTMLIDLTLDGGAEQADELDVSVSFGTTTLSATGAHSPGAARGTMELDFPSYPANQSVSVTVTAFQSGTAIGSNTQSFAFDAGCTRGALTVSGNQIVLDLAGVDLTGVILDLTTPPTGDLAGADLDNRPGPDMAGPSDTTATCPLNGLAANCGVNITGSTTISSSTGCQQAWPPPPRSPGCDVPDGTGTTYYVSDATGDDNNTGLTALAPWKTLCKAATAPAHSTVRVANGTYSTSTVLVTSAISIEGGWDSSLTLFDPDSNPTYFTGTLVLDNDGAVWGGFKMIQHPMQGVTSFSHHILAGTFVYNYVEVDYNTTASENYFTAMFAAGCAGHTTRFWCNDLYVDATKTSPDGDSFTGATALSVRLTDGATLDLAANRMCHEGTISGAYTVSVYGANTGSTSSLLAANNLIELPSGGASNTTLLAYSAGGDFSVVLTNNTLIGHTVLGSYGTSTGAVTWSFANNIIFTGNFASTPFNFDTTTSGIKPVKIAETDSNLIFGFTNNAFMPAPMTSSGDNVTGSPTIATTFDSPSNLRPSPTGAAAGAGDNVYGAGAWGNVTTDLDGNNRPATGPWDRGAYLQ
jgi:hypothetical protein